MLTDQSSHPTLRERIHRRFFSGSAGQVSRGMLTLALGSGLGRLIAICTIPILTRLYSPEDFGVLAIFTAFLQVLIPVTTFRYAIAIPLPRSDRLAFGILLLCLALATVFSLIFGVTLLLFGATILKPFSMEALASFWWLIALGIFGASTYEALTMWATRKCSYPIIAQTQVLQSVSGESLKILIGLLASTPLGLMLGQIASYSSGLGRLALFFRSDFQLLSKKIKWKHSFLAARNYRDFPLYRLPAQVLLTLSMQAPLLFAAFFYDPETTGQLGLAIMATSLPFLLIGQAASRSVYGEIRGKSAKQMRSITRQTVLRLLTLAIPISITLYFFAEQLFVFVFGAQWRVAGNFASILSLYLAPQFASTPLLEIFNVTSKQRTYLFMHSFRASMISATATAAFVGNLEATLFVRLYSVSLSIYYVALAIIIIRHIRDLQEKQ